MTLKNNNFIGQLLGIGLVLALAVLSTLIAELDWFRTVSISAMIVGIIIGMIFANLPVRQALPASCNAGIKFCSKRILRTGIVLYGFRLTLTDVAEVGIAAVIIDAIIVCSTIGLGLLIGRTMKMDKDITLLTSCGSAICGAAAVLGAEGAISAKPYKTAVAVSTVVIFGTLAMFLYPVMDRMGILGLDPSMMGIYTGATVHEVAHVVGAGNAMGPEAASTSMIVKMIRVMMLVPVLILLAFWAGNRKSSDTPKEGSKKKIVIPWFAINFLIVIIFNSLVALPSWLTEALNFISTFCLTMAMTALGVETSFDKFKQAGAKPFILATLLFVWLLAGGYLLVLTCKAFAI